MLDRRFYLPYSPLTFEEKKYEEDVSNAQKKLFFKHYD